MPTHTPVNLNQYLTPIGSVTPGWAMQSARREATHPDHPTSQGLVLENWPGRRMSPDVHQQGAIIIAVGRGKQPLGGIAPIDHVFLVVKTSFGQDFRLDFGPLCGVEVHTCDLDKDSYRWVSWTTMRATTTLGMLIPGTPQLASKRV